MLIRPRRVLVVAELDVDTVWMNRIAGWLAAIGCLYCLAWGIGCADWDDAVDWANVAAFEFGDVPHEQLIMTTWHEKETLEEAMHFTRNHALHPVIDLSETLILQVSNAPRRSELLRLWDESQ